MNLNELKANPPSKDEHKETVKQARLECACCIDGMFDGVPMSLCPDYNTKCVLKEHIEKLIKPKDELQILPNVVLNYDPVEEAKSEERQRILKIIDELSDKIKNAKGTDFAEKFSGLVVCDELKSRCKE
jgi:hypothetical protein